jgi:hypothetical protein
MNRTTVTAAIDEAERFIKRAKVLLATDVQHYERNRNTGEYGYVKSKWKHSTDAPKQTGAVKRASMDLTRALAEMRKP